MVSTSPKVAVRELADAISLISERYWCAGWRHGIEFLIWDKIHGAELVRGNLPLTDEELSAIRTVASPIDGWLLHTNQGLFSVPLDVWLPLYRRYRTGESMATIFDAADALVLPEWKVDWS